MADKTSETAFLDFLKKADDSEIEFSSVAQESSKETREKIPNRSGLQDTVLGSKKKSDAAEKALIGNILSTRDFETSNIQVKSVEKVSFPRSSSLMETVLKKCGRL